MNLEKQLGQLFIIGFRGTELAPGSLLERLFEAHEPAGVILFDRCLHSPEEGGNISDPTQLAALIAALQALSRRRLFICIDQEGGSVQRLKAERGFAPTVSAQAMGQKDSPEFTLSQSEHTAAQLAALGINVNFAPVADLNSNPDNPVIGKIGRSFAAHPEKTILHLQNWIKGHGRKGVISCLKHFPGHGSSAADSHLGFVDISTSWQEIELEPYQTLIDDGYDEMIMTGHLFNRTLDPEYPATLSKRTIDGLLRKKLRFNGIVVSDDMQMNAITGRYGFDESIQTAIAAGVDMIVIGNNLKYHQCAVEDGVAAVLSGLRKGVISEERVAEALGRIQRTKQSLEDSW